MLLRRHLPAALLLLVLLSPLLHAQGEYRSHSQLGERLRALAAASSGRASVRSIVKSPGGRDLRLMTIGDRDADTRPALLLVGGVDPTSPTGRELSLRMIERLLTDRSDSVVALLKRSTFY